MANLFLNLPLPVLNGPGAAVDVSLMGTPRTITCVGSFQGTTIAIEASSDGGSTFSPLTTFQNNGGEQVLPAVVQFVRTLVSGRKLTVPFAADIDIGASDAGSQFAVLPLPVLNGPGAAVDVSAFGDLTTMVVTGAFAGAAVAVEISEDNIVWAVLVAFGGQGGIKTKAVTANWARANVSGRKAGVPFSAVVAIGAADFGGGGGGGAGQVFQYTATGMEPDRRNLVITLPAVRASANYAVQVTQGTFTNLLAVAVPDVTKTDAQFVLALSGMAQVGDTFNFDVEDL